MSNDVMTGGRRSGLGRQTIVAVAIVLIALAAIIWYASYGPTSAGGPAYGSAGSEAPAPGASPSY